MPRAPDDGHRQAWENGPVDRAALARRWRETLEPFGAPVGAIDAAFAEISDRYDEERRSYHTLEHIDRVLRSVADLQDAADDGVVVELAAWLHDVVYDPRAGDNEDRSAAYARGVLGALGIPTERVNRVAALILATAHQEASPDDRDAAVLLDADLAVLGAHPDVYDAYCAGVREEYGWLPEPEFRVGRAALLRRLLARDRIFHTAAMWSLREAQARRNMERELEALERKMRD